MLRCAACIQTLRLASSRRQSAPRPTPTQVALSSLCAPAPKRDRSRPRSLTRRPTTSTTSPRRAFNRFAGAFAPELFIDWPAAPCVSAAAAAVLAAAFVATAIRIFAPTLLTRPQVASSAAGSKPPTTSRSRSRPARAFSRPCFVAAVVLKPPFKCPTSITSHRLASHRIATQRLAAAAATPALRFPAPHHAASLTPPSSIRARYSVRPVSYRKRTSTTSAAPTQHQHRQRQLRHGVSVSSSDSRRCPTGELARHSSYSPRALSAQSSLC